MKWVILLLVMIPSLWADKIHVLGQPSLWKFDVVIHTATPSGSNSAGFTWVNVLEVVKAKEIADCTAAGLICTGSLLLVGTLPGEILQTELDAIVAGTTMEIKAILGTGSCGENIACANGEADKEILREQARLQVLYKRYGQKVN